MLLSLQNIHKTYINEKGVQRHVLKGLNLQLNPLESIAIVGPSGSGKSTLLNIIGLMDHQDEGTIQFNGSDISKFHEKEKNIYRNKSVGFVFQEHHLLPQFTAIENILLPTLAKKEGNAKQDENEALSLMEKLDILPLQNNKPAELSFGECQRVAIARALINRPSMILADEPSGALDEQNAENIGDLLLKVNQEEKMTMIVVTHSMEFAGKMQKVYTLRNGLLES